MSWERLEQSLAEFDKIVSRLGVRIGDDAPVKAQFELTREFLADHSVLSENELMAKWQARFKEFYDAAIVAHRLTQSVVALSDQPASALRKRLNQVLSGSLTLDFSPDQAKDYFYELEVAAIFKQAGFTVVLREPDVVVRGNGLTGELGMACKYPSSEAQIHKHLSKGYRQLANQNMDGCVVIGLDIIVFRSVFKSAPKCLDFRRLDKHPLDVAQHQVNHAMKALAVQRERDYPSEPRLDGAITTFSMWGIWNRPAGLASVTAWALSCNTQNPRYHDIERLVQAGQQITKN